MSPVNPETGLVSLPPFISGVSRQALVAKTVNSLIDGLSGRTITNLQIRGGITINGTVAVSTSGAMSSGATAILTGDGYYMDYNAGTPRFRVGTVAAGALTAGMYWSGSSLSVMGAITATSGSIGGWTINATSITDAAGVVGMSSAVTAGDDIRFWAGDATPANAEFRVTESGALTATSATISGSITATSGYIGGWTIGATTLVGGDVTLNSAGSVTLATSASSAPTDSSIRWVEGANLRAYQWMFGDGVATNSKVWGTTIQKADNASLAAASFVIKNVAGAMIGQWNMIVDASGNRYMNTDGYIYPGTGSATQAGRYIYDNGSNIVVDSVVVATHTHTGGAGGTIAWASIDKATSSIADITTKSAGALDSGNLAYARMPTGLGTWTTSGNVTLAYSVNAGHILTVQNLNTGTGAYAEVAAAVSGGPDTISMFALGPGYTTAGMYIAETGYLTTSSGMTGGMKIAVIANAAMDFYTNNSLRMTIEAGGDVNFSGALYPGNQTTHGLYADATYISLTTSSTAYHRFNATGFYPGNQTTRYISDNATSLTVSATLSPVANDGAALGTTALGFSDLHLATGGVVNWANGNMTVTHTAGQLELSAGILSLVGGKVAFPATQSASADANTLDDYEEGTWEVTVTPSTSGSVTLNASYNTGSYTKIGDIVHCGGLIRASTNSSPLGDLQISLPFAVAAGTETSTYWTGSVSMTGINVDAGCVGVAIEASPGNSYAILRMTIDAGTWTIIPASEMAADTDWIMFQLTYKA